MTICITKKEIVDELVQYEINWFNDLEYTDRQQYLKDFFLNGLKGVEEWSDEWILKKCVDIGIFLTEE